MRSFFSQVRIQRIQRAAADGPAPPKAAEVKDEVVVEAAKATAATKADELLPSLEEVLE